MFRPISVHLMATTFITATVCSTVLTISPLSSAAPLPTPSRTMYKCKINGTTTYSDTPCLGATKLEVEPTSGVNKLSGKERTGHDVFYERDFERFAQNTRPLTGMDAKQLKTATRRNQLSPLAQQACRQLDQELPMIEDEERRAVQPALRDVQAHLFIKRKKFHELGC